MYIINYKSGFIFGCEELDARGNGASKRVVFEPVTFDVGGCPVGDWLISRTNIASAGNCRRPQSPANLHKPWPRYRYEYGILNRFLSCPFYPIRYDYCSRILTARLQSFLMMFRKKATTKKFYKGTFGTDTFQLIVTLG